MLNLTCAAPRPHRRVEAMSAPWRRAFSFSQTTGSITYSRPVNVPKPQSALAITRSRSPTAATASSSLRATTSGCSTILLFLSTTPGRAACSGACAAQRLQFVLVARIAELDAERAHVGLIEHRQDQIERDIVKMRAIPIAPAAMQAHAIAGDAVDGLIDRRHVHLRGLDELRVGKIAIKHGPVHGQIGRIDLQQQARAVDGEIFVAHLARQGGQIGLLRIIERVEHRGGDDAGRGRGHEASRRTPPNPSPRVGNDRSRGEGGKIEIMQLGLCFRGVLHAAAFGKPPRQIVHQLGKFLEVAAAAAFRFARETRHAARAHRFEIQRAAARRRCRYRCRPRPARRRRGGRRGPSRRRAAPR